MKIQKTIFALCFACSLLVGCDAPPEKTNDKIDKTVEHSKELLDHFGEKAKEFVNDKELQAQLKEALKDMEGESEDLARILKEKGDDWKAKLEELQKDPEFKEKLKKLEGDAGDILKKLEEIAEEVSKE